MYGRSETIRRWGGTATGDPAHCFVTCDDVAPRSGDSVEIAAYVLDDAMRVVARAGVTVTFTLYKNGGTGDTTGATLNSATGTTDDNGIATTTVTFDAAATASDVYQVLAVPSAW